LFTNCNLGTWAKLVREKLIWFSKKGDDANEVDEDKTARMPYGQTKS